MARMKEVRPPGEKRDVLLITVDPLRVARGHRQLRRGGVHGTVRRPSRAQAKQQLRREQADQAARRGGW